MHKSIFLLAAASIGLLSASATLAQGLSPDERATQTVNQMTQDEMLTLVKGFFPAFEKSPAPDAVITAGYVPGNARLGLPPLRESDAGMGVANLLNKRTDDVATSLPSGLGVAASWDKDIAYAGGAMIGSEARSKGLNVLLAGGVNLVRDARNGRNFEYAGEDPLLSGVMAGYAVKGVQSNSILSTVKHFAINAQETGRNVLSSKIDEASLRESDLLAFEIAIEIGQPASVMCGYNRINGVYACENDFLLNQVLKTDWKYKGWVMSDWGSVHSTTPAALAGLDHQSGFKLDPKPFFGEPLKQALISGEVPGSRLKDMTYRIVRSMYAGGIVDNPVPNSPQPIDYVAHGLVSQRAAEAGIVLLKNDKALLPLVASKKTIAVIGGHADIGVLSGGGSSQVRPVGGPALELKPTGMSQAFARITYFPSSPLQALKARFPDAQFTYVSGDDVPAVVSLAKASDMVIVFANQWATESEDVPNIDLPDSQDQLIDAVAGARKPTVVVLQTGGPVAMPWKDKVGAIVEAWYPGSNGGPAIVRVLSGDVDAAGHLPLTFPTDVAQLPRSAIPGLKEKTSAKGIVTYGLDYSIKAFDVDYTIEGSNVGYRWFDHQKTKPLYAFGHGLSYTQFGYSAFKLDSQMPLHMTFEVRNQGKLAGIDTPQVYATVKGRDGVPVKRLVGWGRVSLEPGQKQSVSVEIDPRLLANFDVTAQRWVVTPGRYALSVGHASDALVKTIEVDVAAATIAP